MRERGRHRERERKKKQKGEEQKRQVAIKKHEKNKKILQASLNVNDVDSKQNLKN